MHYEIMSHRGQQFMMELTLGLSTQLDQLPPFERRLARKLIEEECIKIVLKNGKEYLELVEEEDAT